MRCLFVVQGEGRGHMTQAIAMRHLLDEAGHEICAALVGTSARREIPAFFEEKIGVEVRRFLSPNFAVDARNRGILIGRTFWESLKGIKTYLGAFDGFDEAIGHFRPDLVVNFFEPLFGLYQTVRRERTPSVCIAHQFLSLHPAFPFPTGYRRDKYLLKALTGITSAKTNAILALSFGELSPMKDDRLHVVPPLLRRDLSQMPVTDGDYLLVYLMSAGYAADIEAWHERNPQVALHCFWDRKDAPDRDRRDETLTFHRINDTRFLSLMAGCRGLVTTAGFESVCEAMYLGKPVMMVPVEGHYEQLCNSIDGEKAGAGMRSDRFDLDAFLSYLPKHRADTDSFRAWASGAAEHMIPVLELAANRDQS